jgi:hypothetical protein
MIILSHDLAALALFLGDLFIGNGGLQTLHAVLTGLVWPLGADRLLLKQSHAHTVLVNTVVFCKPCLCSFEWVFIHSWVTRGAGVVVFLLTQCGKN